MSVKMMTTDQLHNDLASIHNMWSGGIPTEQQDRVNALHAELKRRGVDRRPIQPQEGIVARSIDVMSEEQLAKELRDISERISKSPNDETLQEQFANIRFELRKRAKQAQPVIEQPKVTGAFDPVTGETFMQQQAAPTNGNGHAKQLIGQLPPSEERMQALKAEFVEKQQAAQRAAEEMMRKHTVAQLAAKVTAGILTKFGDPNGDDVENACVIGVQVAQSIAAKVGL